MMMTRNLNLITRGIIVLSLLAILNPVLGSDIDSESSIISISQQTEDGGSGDTDDDINTYVLDPKTNKFPKRELLDVYKEQQKKDGKCTRQPVADSIFHPLPNGMASFSEITHANKDAENKDEYTKFRIFQKQAANRLQTYDEYIKRQTKKIEQFENDLSQKLEKVKPLTVEDDSAIPTVINKHIQKDVSQIDREKAYLKELVSGRFRSVVENKWLNDIDSDIEKMCSVGQHKWDIKRDIVTHKRIRRNLQKRVSDAEKKRDHYLKECELLDSTMMGMKKVQNERIQEAEEKYQTAVYFTMELENKYKELQKRQYRYHDQINEKFEQFKVKFYRKIGDFVFISDEHILEQLEEERKEREQFEKEEKEDEAQK